ncbi:hypothetical protein MPH_08376 [Macrophomina phaseolina MS6]|uniref:B30.2/SPRY domain-containing protein n=1 Tax=Macrophomina phaseolina (strain MS6) TaxID=1126212 RepID=K2RNK4_MACPH|nr:hypothetical protein MPH_08376 [Macrophomina phaseolina MS6]
MFATVIDKVDQVSNQNAAAEIERRFDANLNWFRQGHIIDLHAPIDRYHENVSKERRHKDSCKWILEERAFVDWTAGGSSILCLTGEGGTGKSVLLSTVIESLEKAKTTIAIGPGKEEQKPLLLYFFCRYGDTNAAESSKIMLHLCAQLFHKAKDQADGHDEQQVKLQRDCNAVVQKAKENLADSEKKRPAYMKMPALQSLFQELGRVGGRPLVIVVDALDECSDDTLLGALRSLAKLDWIRILISSRPSHVAKVKDTDQNGDPRMQFIHIDGTKTSSQIQRYCYDALKQLKPRWSRDNRNNATNLIVEHAEGKFKYAASVMQSLQTPKGSFLGYSKFMKELPHGTIEMYRRKIDELNEDNRTILITALRWLICGEGTMELMPIADELSETYVRLIDGQAVGSQETDVDTADDGASKNQDLTNIKNSFSRVGRDFLRLTGTSLQLEHNSVRDFVRSGEDKRVAEAGGKKGNLRMAEQLIHTLNSSAFQKKYLSKRALKRGKTQKSAKGSKSLRYELENWPKHLRAAEIAVKKQESDRNVKQRWNSLLQGVEQFMDLENKAYQAWLGLSIGGVSKEDRTGDLPVHTASRYGFVSLIHKYVANGEANKVNKNLDTPLHLVCLGHAGFLGMQALLGHADVNAGNADHATPLLLAIKNVSNDVTPIVDLLNAGADATRRDRSHTTCLHLAAASHNIEACEILLGEHVKEGSPTLKQKPEVEVDAKDHMGETPLHWACKWPNAPVQLIRLLLKNGADLNAQDKESQAPLYEACSVGNNAVARYLLSEGADINDDDTKKDTALHAAIYTGNLSVVKTLVEHNSEKLAKAIEDAGQKAAESIRELRKLAREVNAADLFKTNGEKQDAVVCAASNREFKIMHYLLDTHEKRGSNLKFLLHTDENRMTPLHHCIKAEELAATKRLLEIGEGKTGHGLPRDEHKPGKTLSRAMCEVEDKEGDQPLHTAAWRGNHKLVKLLIEHGAPISARSREEFIYGTTPLDVAFSSWQRWSNLRSERSRMLEDIIEDLFTRDRDRAQGHLLKLTCAIERSSTRVFKLFKKWHSHRDEYGWTPKMIAAQYGFIGAAGDDTQPVTIFNTSPPTKWNSADRDERLAISEDGLTASYKPDGEPKKVRMSVRADNPVQPDTTEFYFEIHVSGGSTTYKPIVGVGLCTKIAILRNTLPGWRYARALTWGYQGDSGKKYAQQHEGETYSGRFGAGDTVGCGLDLSNGPNNGTIYFTRNGKKLETAFTGVKGQLFPVIGIDGRSTEVHVRVNFGHDNEQPFEYRKMNRTGTQAAHGRNSVESWGKL